MYLRSAAAFLVVTAVESLQTNRSKVYTDARKNNYYHRQKRKEKQLYWTLEELKEAKNEAGGEQVDNKNSENEKQKAAEEQKDLREQRRLEKEFRRAMRQRGVNDSGSGTNNNKNLLPVVDALRLVRNRRRRRRALEELNTGSKKKQQQQEKKKSSDPNKKLLAIPDVVPQTHADYESSRPPIAECEPKISITRDLGVLTNLSFQDGDQSCPDETHYDCIPSKSSAKGGHCLQTRRMSRKRAANLLPEEDITPHLMLRQPNPPGPPAHRTLQDGCPEGCPYEFCECYAYEETTSGVSCDKVIVDACAANQYVEYCSGTSKDEYPVDFANGKAYCDTYQCLYDKGLFDQSNDDGFCDYTQAECMDCYCALYAGFCTHFQDVCADPANSEEYTCTYIDDICAIAACCECNSGVVCIDEMGENAEPCDGDREIPVPEPTMEAPEPTMAVPEPTVAVPEPTVAVPEPTVAVPECCLSSTGSPCPEGYTVDDLGGMMDLGDNVICTSGSCEIGNIESTADGTTIGGVPDCNEPTMAVSEPTMGEAPVMEPTMGEAPVMEPAMGEAPTVAMISGCPEKEPIPMSECLPEQEGLECNLGQEYSGDPTCSKNCEGGVWTFLCAGDVMEPTPVDVFPTDFFEPSVVPAPEPSAGPGPGPGPGPGDDPSDPYNWGACTWMLTSMLGDADESDAVETDTDEDACWTSTVAIGISELLVTLGIFPDITVDMKRCYSLCTEQVITIGIQVPNSIPPIYNGGDYPLPLFNPNVHIRCGEFGRSQDNCVLSGGNDQFTTLYDRELLNQFIVFLPILMPDLPELGDLPDDFVPNTNSLVVEGVTFEKTVGLAQDNNGINGLSASVNLNGPGLNMVFSDCIWRSTDELNPPTAGLAMMYHDTVHTPGQPYTSLVVVNSLFETGTYTQGAIITSLDLEDYGPNAAADGFELVIDGCSFNSNSVAGDQLIDLIHVTKGFVLSSCFIGNEKGSKSLITADTGSVMTYSDLYGQDNRGDLDGSCDSSVAPYALGAGHYATRVEDIGDGIYEIGQDTCPDEGFVFDSQSCPIFESGGIFDPGTPAPKPTASAPEPTVSAPEPTASAPEPTASAPPPTSDREIPTAPPPTNPSPIASPPLGSSNGGGPSPPDFDGPICPVCPGGERVPSPARQSPQYGKACRELELDAETVEEGSDKCREMQIISIIDCGCEYVTPADSPADVDCTLCPGSFAPLPTMKLNEKDSSSSCGAFEWQAINFEEAQCTALQATAGKACGCADPPPPPCEIKCSAEMKEGDDHDGMDHHEGDDHGDGDHNATDTMNSTDTITVVDTRGNPYNRRNQEVANSFDIKKVVNNAVVGDNLYKGNWLCGEILWQESVDADSCTDLIKEALRLQCCPGEQIPAPGPTMGGMNPSDSSSGIVSSRPATSLLIILSSLIIGGIGFICA